MKLIFLQKLKLLLMDIFGNICKSIKKESLLYKIYEKGKDRIEKEMDILWIIKRIRKIKLLSNQLRSDQKLKSKYLIIDDSDSDIQ